MSPYTWQTQIRIPWTADLSIFILTWKINDICEIRTQDLMQVNKDTFHQATYEFLTYIQHYIYIYYSDPTLTEANRTKLNWSAGSVRFLVKRKNNNNNKNNENNNNKNNNNNNKNKLTQKIKNKTQLTRPGADWTDPNQTELVSRFGSISGKNRQMHNII